MSLAAVVGYKIKLDGKSFKEIKGFPSSPSFIKSDVLVGTTPPPLTTKKNHYLAIVLSLRMYL